VGKKKDSPRGKECFGVREFTQLWVRSIERQRGRRDAEVTRGNGEATCQERYRSRERQRGRDTEVARGNMAGEKKPELL